MKNSLFLAALISAATLLGSASASAQTTPGTVSGPTGSGAIVTSPASNAMSQSTSETRTTTTSQTTRPKPVARPRTTKASKTTRATGASTTVKRKATESK